MTIFFPAGMITVNISFTAVNFICDWSMVRTTVSDLNVLRTNIFCSFSLHKDIENNPSDLRIAETNTPPRLRNVVKDSSRFFHSSGIAGKT